MSNKIKYYILLTTIVQMPQGIIFVVIKNNVSFLYTFIWEMIHGVYVTMIIWSYITNKITFHIEEKYLSIDICVRWTCIWNEKLNQKCYQIFFHLIWSINPQVYVSVTCLCIVVVVWVINNTKHSYRLVFFFFVRKIRNRAAL